MFASSAKRVRRLQSKTRSPPEPNQRRTCSFSAQNAFVFSSELRTRLCTCLQRRTHYSSPSSKTFVSYPKCVAAKRLIRTQTGFMRKQDVNYLEHTAANIFFAKNLAPIPTDSTFLLENHWKQEIFSVWPNEVLYIHLCQSTWVRKSDPIAIVIVIQNPCGFLITTAMTHGYRGISCLAY